MFEYRSGRQFLERIGIISASKYPKPRLEPRSIRAHELELDPPLPLPEFLEHLDGEPSPPDRYQTKPWPHDTTSDDNES